MLQPLANIVMTSDCFVSDPTVVPILERLINTLVTAPIFKDVVLNHPFVNDSLENMHILRITISSVTPDMVGNPITQEYNLVSTATKDILRTPGYSEVFRKFHLVQQDFQQYITMGNSKDLKGVIVSKLVPEDLTVMFVEHEARIFKQCKILYKLGTTVCVNHF